MKVMTGITKVIRDHVAKAYKQDPLHVSGLMLLAAADTIERLTRERDEAMDEIQRLLISKRDELLTERDKLRAETDRIKELRSDILSFKPKKGG